MTTRDVACGLGGRTRAGDESSDGNTCVSVCSSSTSHSSAMTADPVSSASLVSALRRMAVA
jgi:hypothetical protein